MLNYTQCTDTSIEFNRIAFKVFYPITFDNRTRLWQCNGKSHTDFNSAYNALKEN